MDVQGSELNIIKVGLEIIKNAKFLSLELQTQEYNKGLRELKRLFLF
jgi:hypothetical protein